MTEREIARKKAAARRARRERERKARNRRVVLTVCLMLAVCVASIGGTVAWLTATTDPVTNTFSPSNIGLTLAESPDLEFKMIPGNEYKKDPVVTITNDVEAWLFVEVDEDWIQGSYNLDSFLDYTLTLNGENSGWTKGTGTGEGNNGVPTNVWYRTVPANAVDKTWKLLAGKGEGELKDGYVAVDTSVTKEMMAVLGVADKYPTLSFKAYAIQTASFADVGDAWTQLTSTSSEVPSEPESGT